MVFSSLVFVFAFFPIIIIGGLLLRNKIIIQNYFLFALSVLFYAWGEPKRVLLFLFTIVINWACALVIQQVSKKKQWFAIGAVLVDILILFVFKYSAWICEAINSICRTNLPVNTYTLPIGISFYTFQAMSYVIDVVKGKVIARKNPFDVGLYIAFFPQLIAGPIVRYEDFEKQIYERKITMDSFALGIERFLMGFSKKVLLADSLAVIVDKAFKLLSEEQLGLSFAWLGGLAYTFQIFFDFSGYSDMAIGLGGMFGFNIPENFNMPYISHSFREFWHRWHISLSGWFRDYVYIPLGGNKKGQKRTYLNMAIVWLLTGLWHGANLTFLIWGGLYGGLIITERAIDLDSKVNNNKFFRMLYRVWVFIAVILLWIIFRADNILVAENYIRAMFSFTVTDVTVMQFTMYIHEFRWELLMGYILSFWEIPSQIKINNFYQAIRAVFLLVMFVISISYLVKGNFSPFLYFNF